MKTKLLAVLCCTLCIMSCTNNKEVRTFTTPAFNQLTIAEYVPAFEAAIAQAQAEIDAIVNNPDEPTFENTIVALDRAGLELELLEGVFFNVLEADGNAEMDAAAEQIMPMVTTFSDNMMLNEGLFARVKAVYTSEETNKLTSEQKRLLSETYKGFVNSGAELCPKKKARLKEINQELALLSLQFGNNVVAETNAYKLFITNEDELKGLPESAKTAAKEEAVAAGRPDAWLFTPKRTSFTPVLQYCENRELRKELLMAYTTRGNHDNANDNKSLINKTMHLRVERAKLFGYDNPADYILNDCMAHDSKTVNEFLQSVWQPSLVAVHKEIEALQAMTDEKIEPWDWWYYAEKLRQEKYALDEEELKPYFELSNVRKGAFAVATKLYGLQFEQVQDMPVYNPEVEVFKVTDANNELVGFLYTDYFPRAGKRPGAWMNNITPQYVDAEGVNHRPVIINVGNFNKPTADQPSLLSMDDVETLFHEFGHALHGLMSQCTYKSLAGTNVPRDFVELPSQFMENYCYDPQVLKMYAFHYQTGEVIPDALIAKINNASHFNQGFVTVELLSASILDMDYHCIDNTDEIDVNAFEQASMEKMQMVDEIIVRYRSTFFNHIFTTGYEAGYYSYTWSAVLDADAFAAFAETGDIFNPKVAKRFKKLLESGNKLDAQENYLQFRGKAADPAYLLKRKGFTK